MMKNLLKDSYILIIFFIVFIFKDAIYNLFIVEHYKVDNCIYVKNMEENYNDLLEFSNIDIKYNMKYVNSYILYKDMYNYMNEVTILGGTNKDIKKDSAVIYNNTLVGIVDKVKKSTSIVKLLNNKDTKLSVKINEEVGIFEYDNTLKITGISNYGNINIGDLIYTSGLGDIPGNIYIGKVSDIILSSKNIEKIIYVDNNIDIKNLNYITVLIKDIEL